MQIIFSEKPQIKKNSLKKEKHAYLIHAESDKVFKGTVVNQTFLSLPWRLEANSFFTGIIQNIFKKTSF